MQHALPKLESLSLDVEVLQRRRDLFGDGLRDCGYDVQTPEGAFYVLPKTPIERRCTLCGPARRRARVLLTGPRRSTARIPSRLGDRVGRDDRTRPTEVCRGSRTMRGAVGHLHVCPDGRDDSNFISIRQRSASVTVREK